MPGLTADEARDVLMLLNGTPLQGAQAPRFMHLVQRLNQIVAAAPDAGGATGAAAGGGIAAQKGTK